MKTILSAILILLPCLAVLNESETLIPNICGLSYIFVLHFAAKTKTGKRFCDKFYKEVGKMNDLIFK